MLLAANGKSAVIEYARVIEALTVEIVEHDSLSRRLLDARIAAHNHDPPELVDFIVKNRIWIIGHRNSLDYPMCRGLPGNLATSEAVGKTSLRT